MYNLTISKRQADLIVKALDLYSRLKCGQFSAIKDIFYDFRLDRDESRNLFDQLKKIAFPELQPNESYGICGQDTDDDAQIAYDLLQVIRYRLFLDRKKSPILVKLQSPFKTSNKEKLAEIKSTTQGK